MRIKNGIIFIWSGTNASIPSGWSRVTGLDGKYPKGTNAGIDPNISGGNATHAHTSAGHGHSISDHAHSIYINAGVNSTNQNSQGGSTLSPVAHTHGGWFNSGSVAGGSVASTSVTYGSCSNDPAYNSVIYITPTLAVSSIPTGVIGLADANAPSGFNVCDGNNSTPNLVGKYLKGSGTGADGGGTGGSFANTHDISHSHSTYHYHTAVSSAGANMSGTNRGGSTATNAHTHGVQLDGNTFNISDTLSLVTTETVEPVYTKLLAIRASTLKEAPKGIIAMWLGSLSSIPLGWILCDGSGGTVDMRGRHLKITATLAEVGNTGGSNTHTHSAQNHTHSAVNHGHTCPNQGHAGNSSYTGGGPANADYLTYHTVSVNANYMYTTSGSTSADSANNEPTYLTVAFIKLVHKLNRSDMLLNFILEE